MPDLPVAPKPEAKGISKSKLNWTGMFLVLMGMVSDPMFKTLFGDMVPEGVLSKILFLGGWTVIGLRTFGTSTAIETNWRNPFNKEKE